jgi:hypothetical protein
MKKIRFMLAVAVMAVVLTAVSQGAPITSTGAKHSNSLSAARGVDKVLNATGMDPTQTYLYNQDGVGGVGETTSADNKEWNTGSETGPGWTFQQIMDARKVWAVFDLGAAYDLGKLKIWNFNWDNTPGTPLTSLNSRGVKQFDVYVRNSAADTANGIDGAVINANDTAYAGYLSTNAEVFNLGTSNKWVLALSDQQLAQAANNDTHTSTSFDLSGNYGRFVAIVVDNIQTIGGGCGLGKVRFEDGTGIAHQPDPSNGAEVVAISKVVSWMSPDSPNDPNILSVSGYNVYVDPNQFEVANATPASGNLQYKSLGQAGTSYDPVPDLGYDKTYYWRVDSIVDLTPAGGDPNTIKGKVWSFTTTKNDQPPTVEIGTPNTITWVNKLVQLNATITDPGDSHSPVTITWTSSRDPNTVFSDIHVANPTVTVNSAFATSPYVTLTCSVTDEANPTITNTDTVVLRVYADACTAARVGAGRAALYPMDFTSDCVINLSDFADVAEQWLVDYALTDPIAVP